FGAGGGGHPGHGTGGLIPSAGFVLNTTSPLLDQYDVLGSLSDGRRYPANAPAAATALATALPSIETREDPPFFDLPAAAKRSAALPGTWILAYSNEFRIAPREEPLSVQQGLVAAYTKLHGRRGIYEAPYIGDVYVLDAITNNPGAAGGAVTTRNGELL